MMAITTVAADHNIPPYATYQNKNQLTYYIEIYSYMII